LWSGKMQRKYKYRYYPRDSQKPKDIAERETYWLSVDGTVQSKVSLQKSHLIGKLSQDRINTIRATRKEQGKHNVSSFDPEKEISARVRGGGTLPVGIQLYRQWFQFLKLALELENLGKNVQLSVQQRTGDIKNTGFDTPMKDIPYKQRGIGPLSRSKITTKVKVNRSKYEGWDLDQVLSDTFDNWWEPHRHLFEGHYPKILSSKDEWEDNPDFIYVRIDKTVQKRDIQRFVIDEITKDLSIDGSPRYVIDAPLKPDVLTNAYNCLIHTLIHDRYVMTDQQFWEQGYLRETTASSGIKGGTKTGDGKLSVPTATIQGYSGPKKQWGGIIKPRRLDGIRHLINAMDGRFGKTSNIKFTSDTPLK
jgi:hypothetical protein